MRWLGKNKARYAQLQDPIRQDCMAHNGAMHLPWDDGKFAAKGLCPLEPLRVCFGVCACGEI